MDTADTALAKYLRHLEARSLSPRTVGNYSQDIRGLSAWLSERGFEPLTLDRGQMRGYLVFLTEKEIAPASLRRILSTARLFYRWLASENIIPTDPLIGVNGLPKAPKRLPDILSQEEVLALLQAPDDSPEGIRDRALLEMLYATGMRLAEVVGLDLPAVNVSTQVIRVTGKGKYLCCMGEAMMEELDQAATTKGMSRSAMLRTLVLNYLRDRSGQVGHGSE